MGVAAAILLIMVGLMHSVLGHKKLISPLLQRDNLPIILGSLENTRLTILVGWHITTLFWWMIAGVLLFSASRPETAYEALVLGLGVVCAISGLAALILSKAKHRSWVFFLPIAVLCFLEVFGK